MSKALDTMRELLEVSKQLLSICEDFEPADLHGVKCPLHQRARQVIADADDLLCVEMPDPSEYLHTKIQRVIATARLRGTDNEASG